MKWNLTLILVFASSPKPSLSRMEMYVTSKHMNGWSTFAVAQTSFAFEMKSPTVISPPSNGSILAKKNWINCLFSSVTTNPNPITNRLGPFRLHAQRSSWMLQFDFDLVWLVSDPLSALSCLWLFWRMHQNQRLDFLLLISNGFYHWKCEKEWNLLKLSVIQLFKIQKFRLPESIRFGTIFEWIRLHNWIHASTFQFGAATAAAMRVNCMSDGLQAQTQVAVGEYINFAAWCRNGVYVLGKQWCFVYIFWCKWHLNAATAQIQCSHGILCSQSIWTKGMKKSELFWIKQSLQLILYSLSKKFMVNHE